MTKLSVGWLKYEKHGWDLFVVGDKDLNNRRRLVNSVKAWFDAQRLARMD